MKRTLSLILVLCILVLTGQAQELRQRLASLPGISGIEKLESDHYKEKYLVRISQPVDHQNPAAGTFTQRIIVAHVGYDRPTVIVTEGYGGAYALNPRYQEELAQLTEANMVFVEHRYFLESTPDPLNWDYLTAENAAHDLHRVNQTFRQLYPGKWMSTGISKGGQTTCLYRAYFPDDVDFSVPYVAPLCHGVEDGRHEPFLREVGTKAERDKIEAFQLEVLKRKADMLPLLDSLSQRKKLNFRIPMAEVFDYCVLEYPFAFWQWGRAARDIPASSSNTQTLFNHLVSASGPDYFAEGQSTVSFFVQAARELGYYGYDTKPFQQYLTIKDSKGYLNRIMLPAELVDKVEFRPALYHKIYNFLKDNDPKMIFIYGGIDPWTAARIPSFSGKKNLQIYIPNRGSHAVRIQHMPESMRHIILTQINKWLAE